MIRLDVPNEGPVVTSDKIEVGTPLYGYDWPADPAQPDGYGTAVSRNYQQAEALRVQYGAVRQWSATDAAPYFTYTAADGVQHVVCVGHVSGVDPRDCRPQ